MKKLSAKFHIAVGLTFLMLSIVLIAVFLGLLPDRKGAVMEGRAALAEALAVNSSILISQADVERLKVDLRLVVERNAQILSGAVRVTGGETVVKIGEHDQWWADAPAVNSSENHLRVPIWAGKKKWGQVELRFKDLTPPGFWGFLKNPLFLMMGYLAVSAFIAFYFYLGKMLKHLDPSQAIPGRVRSALDTMAEGLMVVDKKGQLVLANLAFGNVLGKEPDALLGSKAGDLPWSNADGSKVPAGEHPWTQAIKSGESLRNGTICLQDGAGERRTFMLNCSPIFSGSTKAAGVLVSLDDITELEQKEVELRKSKEDAEAANRSKSQFLANMSHEIRTPMNAILGFTEVLKRGYGKQGHDSKKYLNTISSSGNHLLELINDVLDLSKVESGHMEIENEQFEAYKVVYETVHVLEVKAQEKGIALLFEVDGEIPETINSDAARLRQIVTNLVGNAIKFTEEGGVRVVMRTVYGGESPQLAVDVRDSGIGMKPETLDSVFEAFVQADTSITRRFGGTGLGLSISKKFALAMGGDITVTSRYGHGSCFTAVIDTGPLTDIKLLNHEQVLAAVDTVEFEKHGVWEFPESKILVVDDGVENRELVTLVLEEAGLNVDCAENGQIAVDMATQKTYDVILMDMSMPVMDGFTATRILREKGMDLPIIAFTAHAMKGFEKEILAAGCTGYQTKPLNIDALFKELADILGGKLVAHDEMDELPGDLLEDEAKPVPETMDHSPIVSRLAGSNPRFMDIVASFVDRLHEQVETMQEAWDERDYTKLKDLGHWLKGAAGTVGFDAFTEPAADFEQAAKDENDSLLEASLAEIRNLAGRVTLASGGSAAQPAPVSPKAPAAAESATQSQQPLVSRLPANNPRFQPIIEKFAVRLREQIPVFEKAWQDRDYAELANLAHWLKGAGGTVGFDAFTEPAAELEESAKLEDQNRSESALMELMKLADRVPVPSEESAA